jgi:hypothetical protein
MRGTLFSNNSMAYGFNQPTYWGINQIFFDPHGLTSRGINPTRTWILTGYSWGMYICHQQTQLIGTSGMRVKERLCRYTVPSIPYP